MDNKKESIDNSQPDPVWQQESTRLGRIMSAYPTDMDKVTMLREYTARLLDIGRNLPRQESYYNSLSLEDASLGRLYQEFSNDRIAANCGLTSLFYIKLLQNFGYAAYRYSFGFTDKPYAKYIHSVALVRVRDGEKDKLIIQDPYLNLTYKDSLGRPLDFFDFLTLLKDHRFEAVRSDSVTARTFLIIPDTTLYFPYSNDSCRALMRSFILDKQGALKQKIPIARNYHTLMQSSCDQFEAGFIRALKANGMDGPLINAYRLRVNSMTGSPDTESLRRTIDAFLERNREATAQ